MSFSESQIPPQFVPRNLQRIWPSIHQETTWTKATTRKWEGKSLSGEIIEKGDRWRGDEELINYIVYFWFPFYYAQHHLQIQHVTVNCIRTWNLLLSRNVKWDPAILRHHDGWPVAKHHQSHSPDEKASRISCFQLHSTYPGIVSVVRECWDSRWEVQRDRMLEGIPDWSKLFQKE